MSRPRSVASGPHATTARRGGVRAAPVGAPMRGHSSAEIRGGAGGDVSALCSEGLIVPSAWAKKYERRVTRCNIVVIVNATDRINAPPPATLYHSITRQTSRCDNIGARCAEVDTSRGRSDVGTGLVRWRGSRCGRGNDERLSQRGRRWRAEVLGCARSGAEESETRWEGERDNLVIISHRNYGRFLMPVDVGGAWCERAGRAGEAAAASEPSRPSYLAREGYLLQGTQNV